MIVLEVQPFLILAVGVDNIFLLVQAYQRHPGDPAESLEKRMGRLCGEVLPSMLLSSSAEAVCFFLGAMSSMPAVRTFSLYAALAILFNFLLQVSCFLAVLSLDIRRQEGGRMEPFCWPRLEAQSQPGDGLLYRLFRDHYAPFLTGNPVRYIVVAVFSVWLASSAAVVERVELGLDQSLSMPRDSYVLRYLEAMKEFLSVGPPVYFVLEGRLRLRGTRRPRTRCAGRRAASRTPWWGRSSRPPTGPTAPTWPSP